MYTPCSTFRRTPAERADQELSWRRGDQAFFAAGACHILAFAFQHLHPDAGFSVIGLRKIGEAWVSHAYVSDGRWAFDHDGWTPEEELLAVTTAAELGAGLATPGHRHGSRDVLSRALLPAATPVRPSAMATGVRLHRPLRPARGLRPGVAVEGRGLSPGPHHQALGAPVRAGGPACPAGSGRRCGGGSRCSSA